MTEYEFTLTIDGDPNTDANLNALFEAGCSDATFGSVAGAAYGTFTRQSDSFENAVSSAIQQIESVDGLDVLAVYADWRPRPDLNRA